MVGEVVHLNIEEDNDDDEDDGDNKDDGDDHQEELARKVVHLIID